MILDSHVHFDMILENQSISEPELIRSLKYNNIEYTVQISVDNEGLEWSRDFSKKHYEDGVYYTLGIHPSSFADEIILTRLESIVSKELKTKYSRLLFGIGECGLDFYRMHQPKEIQRHSFEFQIDLAKKYKLPLIIHSRDAMKETLDILKKHKPLHGIMHCFAGGSKEAKEVLDLGFMLSFAGNLTYKNATELHDAAAYVPPDRLLLETDSPFLAPVPLRGKNNLPENIRHTYRFMAGIKNISLPKLEDAITENFTRLLKK